MQKLTFLSIEDNTEITKRITEIVEHAIDSDEPLYDVEHLKILLNTSYLEGWWNGRNNIESGVIAGIRDEANFLAKD